MMYRRRYSLLVLLMVVGIAVAGAETFAVVVRSLTAMEDERGEELSELLAAVEEGVMDALFNAGHIVFDIIPGEDPDLDRLRAAEDARAGGARYLVLVEAEFEVERTRGVIPVLSTAAVIDLETGDESVAEPEEAGLMPRFYELSAMDLALVLGAASVEGALQELGEVDSVW